MEKKEMQPVVLSETLKIATTTKNDSKWLGYAWGAYVSAAWTWCFEQPIQFIDLLSEVAFITSKFFTFKLQRLEGTHCDKSCTVSCLLQSLSCILLWLVHWYAAQAKSYEQRCRNLLKDIQPHSYFLASVYRYLWWCACLGRLSKAYSEFSDCLFQLLGSLKQVDFIDSIETYGDGWIASSNLFVQNFSVDVWSRLFLLE